MSRFTTDPASWPEAPVILLTGGNAGLGLGIGCRLIDQLSRLAPPDLECSDNPTAMSPFCTPRGCKIVIASRNTEKAKGAIGDLIFHARRCCRGRMTHNVQDGRQASAAQARPLTPEEYTGWWYKNLSIDFIRLDLASVDATLQAAEAVKAKYSYLTHLILNAGAMPAVGLDWANVVHGLVTRPFDFLTSTGCILEEAGRTTEDGLGWTWQCNVLGHYVLARQLLPLLYASKHTETRLLWTSSLEATAQYFDPKDPMALQSKASYGSTKYQAFLLSWHFNRFIKEFEASNKKRIKVRSYAVEPGVVASDIMKDVLGSLLFTLQLVVFWFARLCGAVNLTIFPISAAMAFVHIALSPTSTLDKKIQKVKLESELESLRFGSQASKLGTPYCHLQVVDSSEEQGTDAKKGALDELYAQELSERCDSLYRGFLAVRGEKEQS